jgi:hypothetical protein
MGAAKLGRLLPGDPPDPPSLSPDDFRPQDAVNVHHGVKGVQPAVEFF